MWVIGHGSHQGYCRKTLSPCTVKKDQIAGKELMTYHNEMQNHQHDWEYLNILYKPKIEGTAAARNRDEGGDHVGGILCDMGKIGGVHAGAILCSTGEDPESLQQGRDLQNMCP